jgi:hypothetical protein
VFTDRRFPQHELDLRLKIGLPEAGLTHGKVRWLNLIPDAAPMGSDGGGSCCPGAPERIEHDVANEREHIDQAKSNLLGVGGGVTA